MIQPCGHLQIAFPGFGRNIGSVALQPNETAKGSSRKQDEAHYANGPKFGQSGIGLLFDSRDLYRQFLCHLQLNPMIYLTLNLGSLRSPCFLGGMYNLRSPCFLGGMYNLCCPRLLGGPGRSLVILASK